MILDLDLKFVLFSCLLPFHLDFCNIKYLKISDLYKPSLWPRASQFPCLDPAPSPPKLLCTLQLGEWVRPPNHPLFPSTVCLCKTEVGSYLYVVIKQKREMGRNWYQSIYFDKLSCRQVSFSGPKFRALSSTPLFKLNVYIIIYIYI